MAKALAVLVGVLQMEDGTWAEGSKNSELNVDQIQAILSGFASIVPLKTAGATKGAVLKALRDAAAALSSDDLFVFYFAGHGLSGPNGSPRHLIVLYDEMVDTAELGQIWLQFPVGARIVMVSESCNSGTDFARYVAFLGLRLAVKKVLTAGISRAKTGLADLANVSRLRLGRISPFRDDDQAVEMPAQMIHFGASADGYAAAGGEFTAELLKVWGNGGFQNYRQFFCQTLAAVKNSTFGTLQFPEYRLYGTVGTGFESQKPFTVGVSPFGQPVTKTTILSELDCRGA